MYASMGINRRKALNDVKRRIRIPKVTNRNYYIYSYDTDYDDVDLEIDDDFYDDGARCDNCDEWDEYPDYNNTDDCDCYEDEECPIANCCLGNMNLDIKKIAVASIGVIAGIAVVALLSSRRR